jgi:hypothetical protein
MSKDSTKTFGKLEGYLYGSPNFVPAVYFFEKCTECPNCAIEQLGADLGSFLNSIHYTDRTPVPQIDVVAHSMGGLIVRSYLSGKQQTSRAFSPPTIQKIRKGVFIGTPHFGSFQADTLIADIAFGLGNQTNEMKRGSQFIWDLATWNQFGDDLRGVDALAVIGNAGSYPAYPNASSPGASDGVVALTSGSLDFATSGRTRIVNYCHISLNPGFEATYLGCAGQGIADIDGPSHPTYQIIFLFLLGNAAWQSVTGATLPAQDRYLSKYGGVLFASLNSADTAVTERRCVQYVTTLSSVMWGPVPLTNGAASGELFYNDFVNGTGTFTYAGSTCGPFTATPGVYSSVKCKPSPSNRSVGPLLPGSARVVQSGSTITISGSGFGATQCSTCRVTASNPQPMALQVSSWSDSTIEAFLPSSIVGFAIIGVTTATGSDAINIMAAPTSSIAVSPSSLQFAFTIGVPFAAAQPLQISSTGAARNWTATTSASWLFVTPSSGATPSNVSVAALTNGLTPGKYSANVQISAVGATNGSIMIPVTLTVNGQSSGLAVSAQTLTFNYGIGGSAPPAQSISITDIAGGALSFTTASTASWVTVSTSIVTTPTTVNVAVNPGSMVAGTYSASVSFRPVGTTGTVITVPVTLTIQPPLPTVNITSVLNGASYQPGIASAALVSIIGTNLSQTNRSWQDSDFVDGQLPTSLDGVSVTINGISAYVQYISATQINVVAPDDSTTGLVSVQVTNANRHKQRVHGAKS